MQWVLIWCIRQRRPKRSLQCEHWELGDPGITAVPEIWLWKCRSDKIYPAVPNCTSSAKEPSLTPTHMPLMIVWTRWSSELLQTEVSSSIHWASLCCWKVKGCPSKWLLHPVRITSLLLIHSIVALQLLWGSWMPAENYLYFGLAPSCCLWLRCLQICQLLHCLW